MKVSAPRGTMPRMETAGGRTRPDPKLARLIRRARARRWLLDRVRTVEGFLYLRWAYAARDLRDALDTRRAGRRHP